MDKKFHNIGLDLRVYTLKSFIVQDPKRKSISEKAVYVVKSFVTVNATIY